MQMLTWQGESLRKDFMGCQSLKDVLAKIEDSAWKDGLVVCEVRVNGVFLTEEDEGKLGDSLLNEIDSLEIVSKKPHDLVFQTLDSYILLLPKVRETCISAAGNFRKGQYDLAQTQLRDSLEGCQWFIDALQLLKSNIDALGLQLANEIQWQSEERQMSATVNEMLVALEEKDINLLADVLEYELSTSMENWLKILESTVQTLRANPENLSGNA